VENSSRLLAAMQDARAAGTKVLTWDSDGPPETRDFTITHATPAAVAHALSFELGRILAGKGEFAAITSTLTSPNQNAWIAEFKSRLASEYPDLRLVAVRPCGDDVEKAKQEAQGLLATYPDLKGIVGFCSPAVPGAAQALKEARREDVRLTGVSLPAICRGYIEEGLVQSVVMWKTRNLGYLVGASAQALASGALQPGAVSLRAGRLGSVVVHKDEIRLGRCHIVTRGNLDDFA
jgi:ABC-type sugar transport system substrate-binding protein